MKVTLEELPVLYRSRNGSLDFAFVRRIRIENRTPRNRGRFNDIGAIYQ
jgi:hypothetical protein